MFKTLILCAILATVNADPDNMLKGVKKPRDLEYVLVDILNGIARFNDFTCMAIICDSVYLNVFEGALFMKAFNIPFVIIVVADYEDLLSPNFYTLESLRQARKDGCSAYIIILANGLQAARLLRFGDRYRVLDTRAKYIMLHDLRLFKSELLYLWKRIVNVVFLRRHSKINDVQNKTWFDLSTVPFPNPIKEVLITRRVDIWRNGKFHYNRDIFAEKTKNFNGEKLDVVYLDHVPSVVVTETNNSKKVGGVEIEILNTLASKMNFEPRLYEPINAELNKWGHKQPNGSFSGLLGEMVSGKADVAVGNLQYTPYYQELTDLSIPYTSQCWTFLTPEATTDNSWKTLILPFKLYMWIAVLLVLLVTGSIFYGLAKYYMHLMDYRSENSKTKAIQGKILNVKTVDTSAVGLYLFEEITNSILYTYGMLLFVSLPKLPSGWSIRLLTGWYWLYCILLVVSYRASMTAILANPTPRVTIDTLKELVDSKITCGGWGTETKRFFEESLDDIGQKIGQRFEAIDDPDVAATRITQGHFAYYDSKDFLKYLSVKKNNMNFKMNTANSTTNGTDTAKTGMERNLHIMSDCVVNIPVSIGFHKNSPLKPLADVYLRRIVEVGLVEKWLNDVMYRIRSLERNEEEIKALMNLKKLHGAFIALAVGYFVSMICLIGELIHWHCVVKRDPQFDKYAIDLYYIKKNKKH